MNSISKPLQIQEPNVLQMSPLNQEAQVISPSYGSTHTQDNKLVGEIDLREMFAVLWRRKGTIILIALAVFISVFISTMRITPTYRATVALQIEMDSTKVLNYGVEANVGRGSSILRAKDFYQTQYEILGSMALAAKTIDQLNLRDKYKPRNVVTPFFKRQMQRFKGLFFDQSNERSAEEEAAAQLGEVPAEKRFLGPLSIAPVKDSQIVNVSYDSVSPGLAATIVNALADNYIKMNLDRRIEAASYAEEFLQEALVKAKSRLVESEEELVGYAKEASIFKVGGDDSQSLTSQKLSAISAALIQAESDRIDAQGEFEQSKRAMGVAKVIDNPTIQAIKNSVVKLEGDYQEKLQVYKPSYPLMVQMKRQLSKLNAQIADETSQIERSVEETLRTNFFRAKEREEKLRTELLIQKKDLLSLRDKSISYNTLRREVETNRNLYEGLLKRIKEVGVAGGVSANNISILDPAKVPYKQHAPNTGKRLALGGIVGLLLGVVFVFLLSFLDDRVKSSDVLEKLLGLPLLGVTPLLKGADPAEHSLTSLEQPTSAMAEAFRSLRTNLLFSSKDGAPQVIAFTSALPAEGKSSTCLNLATAFAQSGKRVLLVDADLRKPTIHKRLKLANSEGLSNYLTGQASADMVIQESMIEGVSVVTAGPTAPNPAELLSSERLSILFKLVPETFDLIILDCPPVMGLADALILSNKASATVLVSAFSQSRKRSIEDAHRRLRQAHANLIGFIFTKVKSGGGYGYDYEYQYYYDYGTGNKNLSNKSS